jgi:hypothetical protein
MLGSIAPRVDVSSISRQTADRLGVGPLDGAAALL